MTPRIFGCTCFVQELSLWLDKLSPRSIKCVLIGYSIIQKGYRCYKPSTMKYFTFFKSSPYFFPQVLVTIIETVPPLLSVPLPTPSSTFSLPVSPVETPNPPASKPVRDFKYVYTHHLKVPASEPVSVNPSLVDSPSLPSTSFSDLDILITLRKLKKSCTDHPILNFVSYDHLNPTFRQFDFISTYLEAGYE